MSDRRAIAWLVLFALCSAATPCAGNDADQGDHWSFRMALDYPLANVQSGQGRQGTRAASPALQAGIRYTPVGYWFGAFSAYRYLQPERQAPWNPDFGYSFGYDDWHPYTFSLVYGNAAGNRFSGATRTHFEQGTWSLGFKFPLPGRLEPVFLVGNSDSAGCVTTLSYTHRYSDVASGGLKSGKRVVALGCRYSMPHWWFANATVYWYPVKEQRQPWDPLVTYGFGRSDWHPGTFSFQYGNFARSGRPREGALSLAWSTSWK